MKTLIATFLFYGFFTFSQTKSESVWQLKKVENGVTVYTKDLENTNIKELKAIFQVKSSLSALVALLNDSESFPQWAYRCGDCSTLKRISESEFIRYQTVVAPWPVDDRDFVVKVKVQQDPLSKVVTQSVIVFLGFIPEKIGFERIKIFKGLWTLSPLKNGFVNVEYQLLVDPGGSIPAWLVNMSAVDGPIENAVSMKTMLLKDKYKNVVLAYIHEP
jgi:hypothetical protein